MDVIKWKLNFGSCNFGLKSYLWFQIILKSRLRFLTKFHSTQFNYHYITYPMESARSDWLINTLAPFARGLHAHVCLACLFALFLGWTKIGRQRFSLAVRFTFRLSERQFEAVCLSEIQETWNHRDPSKTLISRSLCQILEVLFPKRKRVFNRGI